MSGWQPISTAPKDGTAVLVFSVVGTDTYTDIAYYLKRYDDADDGQGGDPRNWMRCGVGSPTCGISNGQAVGGATHWMPLPDPPTSSGSLSQEDST